MFNFIRRYFEKRTKSKREQEEHSRRWDEALDRVIESDKKQKKKMLDDLYAEYPELLEE